jgi:antitoxin HicB
MAENINKRHLGSNFDDFLKGENALDKGTSVAKKRIEDWKNEQDKTDRSIQKTKQ